MSKKNGSPPGPASLRFPDLSPEKLNDLLREGRSLRAKLEPQIAAMQNVDPKERYSRTR